MTVRLNPEETRTYFYQVATGRKNITVKNSQNKDTNLTIRHPSSEEMIQGQWVYDKFYERALENRVRTVQQMKTDFIEGNTTYTQAEKSELANLYSKIEALKIKLKKPMNEMICRQKRDKLGRLEKDRFYIKYNKEEKFLKSTAESYANSKRNRYYTFCCTEIFSELGNKFWPNHEAFKNFKDNRLILEIIREFSIFDAGLDHGILRAICKDQMTKTMWRASVKTGAPFFGIPMAGGKQLFSDPVTRWTRNQINLVGWLMYYQNIEESSEPPPDYIYEDDEKFDKYVERMIRKKELERVKNLGSKGGKRKGNESSIFGNQKDVIIMDKEEKDLIWGK